MMFEIHFSKAQENGKNIIKSDKSTKERIKKHYYFLLKIHMKQIETFVD